MISIKKVQKFSLYLYKKHHISSNLKIQKILFFLRVYEMKNGIKVSPIFDNNNENFQAWTYGPVCVDSYYFMCDILDQEDKEIQPNFLFENDEQFEKYDPIINNLNDEEPHQLVFLSHHNLEYINVRKENNIKEWQPCRLPLNETSSDFIKFNDVDKQVERLFSVQ